MASIADKSDKPTKHTWNNANSSLSEHLIANEPWLMDQDARYAELVESGTVPSKERIVVSTVRQARQLKERTSRVYSYEDPAPLSEAAEA